MAEPDFPRKRPRVGRAAFDILSAVELDTQCTSRQKALRGALARLGESRASAGAFSSAFKRQALMIADMLVADRPSGVHILLECAAALPGQVSALAAAIAISRPTLCDFVPALLSGLARQLQLALERRCGLAARLLLRFTAALAAAGVVPAGGVVEQLRAVVAAGAAPGAPARDGAWYAYAALSALPWLCNPPGTAMAAVGGGAPGDVEETLEALLRECRAAAERLDASPLHGGSGAHVALTEDRQRQLDCMFDAAASDAARVVLPALCRSALRQLVDDVDAALAAAAAVAATDGGADAVASSRFTALAVRTIGRPQEDADLAALLLRPPQPRPPLLPRGPPPTAALGADDAGAAAGPSAAEGDAGAAARVTTSSEEARALEAGGAGDDETAAPSSVSADMVDPAAPEALPPEPLALVRWESDAQEWRVHGARADENAADVADAASPVFSTSSVDDLQLRPPFHFFGSAAGLSSSRAVLRAMGLDGPAATPLALWALREVCHDALVSYFPFHRAAADALVWLPQGAAFGPGPRPVPVAPVALECALAQACWLPQPPHAPLYYTITITRILATVESCGDAAATQQCVAALGMVGRIVWKYGHLLDDCVVDRLCHLLAHHLSVSKWEWMWEDWGAAAAAPPHSTQRRILHALLHRTFALAGPFHYDRIVAGHIPQALQDAGCVPVNFTVAAHSVLVPAATPSQMAGDASAPSDAHGASDVPEPVRALAAGVMDLLRAKEEAPGVAALLEAAGPTVDVLTRTVVVAHCIFMHGRANFKHAQTLLERYKALLTAGSSAGGAPPALSGDELAHAVLSAAWQVWRRARHVAVALGDLLCQLGIVTPPQLVAFALAPLVRWPLGHWHASDEAAAAGVDVSSPAARLAFASLRGLSLSSWEAVHRALALAAARSVAARVELAVFRGAGVLDGNAPELDEDAAAAKEAELSFAASAAESEAATAVASAFEHASASAALLLQAAIDHADAGSSGEPEAAQYSEAARIVLAQLRGVARDHAPVVRALYARGRLDAAAGCSHVARVIAAAVAYVPSVRPSPSPLVRDTGMPSAEAPEAASVSASSTSEHVTGSAPEMGDE